MAVISDIIYRIEMCNNQDQLDLTQSDCLQITKYLVNNLNENHRIPGNIYYQFVGILAWNKEHGFITDKQHYWLLDHIWQYIDQRAYTIEELL
jgi:hypothetical protein